jgi:hypothetical protein
MIQTQDITIRRAHERDAAALARLAVLDSSNVPAGDLILAEEGAELRAAVSVADGSVIADPFHRTLSLVELLQLRAGRLGTTVQLGGGRKRRRAWAPSR